MTFDELDALLAKAEQEPAAFRPLVVHSNWGYWDALGGPGYEPYRGEALKDGRYEILWEDGTQTTEMVIIEHLAFEYSDHGHSATGDNDKAFISKKCDHCGETSRNYLRGKKIQLRKV